MSNAIGRDVTRPQPDRLRAFRSSPGQQARRGDLGPPANAEDGRQQRGKDAGRRNRALPAAELVDYPVIRRYRRDLERRGLRRLTIAKYTTDLAAFGRHLHPASILTAEKGDVEAFLDTRFIAPRTRYAWLSGLETFFDWAIDEEILATPNPVARIRRPKLRRAIPRPLPAGDVERALAGAPPETKAYLALGLWAGLRCGEIAGLRRQDVLDTHEPPMLFIADGKGGHERLVPLNPDLLALLRPFMADRSDTQWLFPNRDGRRRPGHEISHRVCHYLRGLEIAATAHQTRHTFATGLYAATRDLRLVQELLGHQNPNTTAVYADWDRKDATAAVWGLTGRQAPETAS